MLANFGARTAAFITTLFVACVMFAASAAADLSPNGKFIKNLADQAIEALRDNGEDEEARNAKFRELLREGFAMDFIGRFALGTYWRQASPEQQQEYLDVFSDYILKTYSGRLSAYSGEQLSVTGESTAENGDVFVATRIERPQGSPVRAEWRVRDFDGQPKIVDVFVEGVSMALTHRQEFASVAQRNGVPGLIETLHARAARL